MMDSLLTHSVVPRCSGHTTNTHRSDSGTSEYIVVSINLVTVTTLLTTSNHQHAVLETKQLLEGQTALAKPMPTANPLLPEMLQRLKRAVESRPDPAFHSHKQHDTPRSGIGPTGHQILTPSGVTENTRCGLRTNSVGVLGTGWYRTRKKRKYDNGQRIKTDTGTQTIHQRNGVQMRGGSTHSMPEFLPFRHTSSRSRSQPGRDRGPYLLHLHKNRTMYNRRHSNLLRPAPSSLPRPRYNHAVRY